MKIRPAKPLAPATASILLALSLAVPAQPADPGKPLKQAGKSPIKVFILAGQSNMEGQGIIKLDPKRLCPKP